MKVLVITGSPHKKGTSALMVEKFIEGALKTGVQINRFDSAIHPKRCYQLLQQLTRKIGYLTG